MYTYQVERALLHKTIAHIAPRLSGKCLDVGSEAKKSRYYGLLTNISSYTSLDLEARHNPDIVGSAEDIPLADNTYDSILCTQVFHRIPHPAKAMGELNRVLKKDGQALISTACHTRYGGRGIDYDYWRITPAGMKLLLEEAGFEVIEIVGAGTGVFTVRNQMLNRYIKSRFNMQDRGIPRHIFNIVFRILGKTAIMLDSVFVEENRDCHIINVVALARKK